jgi:hypothetical protein
MIKEKTEIADLRVNQKINFDYKMKEIQNDPNLLEDANIFQPHEWSVDSSKEYPGTIKLTVPITQTLNRKQANLIFKEEYIKEGLEVVELRSNLYTLIGTLILCFVSIAAYSQITDISNLMYQPEYLCKSSNISNTYNK